MASGVGRNGKISDAYEVALMYANTHYRLCASDVVSLKFPRAPEFDQTVSVEPDGVVNLAAVGDLRLEGLTTPESVQVIEAAYSKLLEDPTVVLELKDFNKPYFLVLGEVNRPGKYDLRGYTSASEALATAGGFKGTAKHSQILLFRRAINDWYEVKPLDFRKFLRGDFGQDAEVRPGDMLFVPRNAFSKLKGFIP
jgi:polysaccharide biosynthesis/export protein